MTKQVTKSQLIDYLNRTVLNADDLHRVYHILHATPYRDTIIDTLVSDKRFLKNDSMLIYSAAVDNECYAELNLFLTNKSLQANIELMPTTGNLFDYLDYTNLSTNFLSWLASYVPYTSVKMGRYEMFLRMIFNGGCTPHKHGDVEVSGKAIEVKSTIVKGSGFRLRGQSGYGSGLNVSKRYLQILNQYYDNNIPEMLQRIITDSKMQVWYVSKTSWMNLAIQDLVTRNVITKHQAAEIWAKGLNEVYITASESDILEKIVNPCILDDGTLNMQELVYYFAAYEFQMYKNSEKFDYFITINHMNDYLMITDIEYSDLVKLIKERFIISAPNTKLKATAQDCVCSLELK